MEKISSKNRQSEISTTREGKRNCVAKWPGIDYSDQAWHLSGFRIQELWSILLSKTGKAYLKCSSYFLQEFCEQIYIKKIVFTLKRFEGKLGGT